MNVELQSITPRIEETIVHIARVSSKREDKTAEPEKLINYLIKNKHWSPFEHGSITMEITTSKAMAIQLLRHVSFRFQEFSQRYAEVEALENVEFRRQAEKNRQSSTEVVGALDFLEGGKSEIYLADFVDNSPEIGMWLQKVSAALENLMRLYKDGLKLGIARECARMILPMTAQTTLYMTGPVRSWIHLFDVRDDSHAQKEVRDIAKAMKNIFIEQCPVISNARDYKVQEI